MMKARSLLLIFSAFLITFSEAEGDKVRACAGQEANLNCPSGHYVDVISAVGGFGPSGTPCTSTASCTTSYVQGALTEVNGNLGALFIKTCKNKQNCSVMIQSSWQGRRADCNNQLYNIIYVDVEYSCGPLSTTTSTSPASSTTKSSSQAAPTSTIGSSSTAMTTTTTTTSTTTTSTTTKTTSNTQTLSRSTGKQNSADQTTSHMKSERNGDSTEGNWWWYVVAGVGGVLVIIIIVITVICVIRRRKKDNDNDERRNSGMMYTNGQSDEVTAYITTTAQSAGNNKPDILYDSTINDDDDDIRVSTIDCYATTPNRGSAACGTNDVISDDDKSGDGTLYAVVNKNRKRTTEPLENTMVENETYASA